MRAPGALVPLLLAMAALGHGGLLAAQELQELAVRCAGERPDLLPRCQDIALAVRAHQTGLGLVATGGTAVPGNASTLGHRLGRTPRVTLNTRIALIPMSVPDVLRRVAVPAPEESFYVSTAQVGLAVGVLEGYSLVPTLGGIFALDLFADADFLFLPASEGYVRNVGSWGVGARLGIVRESFTAPGITVSAAWRNMDRVQIGELAQRDPFEADLCLSARSLRIVAGKDLFGLGLVAGVGWDRYSSDVALELAPPPPSGEGTADGVVIRTRDLGTSRRLFFGGASMTFLVIQISAELGWGEGSGDLPGRVGGGYDPEGSTIFASVAARITF